MSYIKKIESDYNNKIISLNEISKLRDNYNSLPLEKKRELDKEFEEEFEEEFKEELDKEFEEEINIQNENINSSLGRNEENIETIKNILIYFVILSLIYIGYSIYVYFKVKNMFN
jgi:hypothetical protein